MYSQQITFQLIYLISALKKCFDFIFVELFGFTSLGGWLVQMQINDFTREIAFDRIFFQCFNLNKIYVEKK